MLISVFSEVSLEFILLIYESIIYTNTFSNIYLLHTILTLGQIYNHCVCLIWSSSDLHSLYVADSPNTLYKMYFTGHINVAVKEGREILCIWQKADHVCPNE